MTSTAKPVLVAIVGGSGAGKSWLSGRLQDHFESRAARLSLDDFYRDRSKVAPNRRSAINFDHPNAIDWPLFQQLMTATAAGVSINVPRYDFKNHTRASEEVPWRPAALVLVDGLWLLHRPAVRQLFDFSIFLECPEQLRLERREARDISERGRSLSSIRRRFAAVVEPMHELYVAPQARWADMLLTHPIGETDIYRVALRLAALLAPSPMRRQELPAASIGLERRVCE
jgi:uridine kinase